MVVSGYTNKLLRSAASNYLCVCVGGGEIEFLKHSHCTLRKSTKYNLEHADTSPPLTILHVCVIMNCANHAR